MGRRAIVRVLLLTAFIVSPLHGQAQSDQKPLAFEVASVKTNVSGTTQIGVNFQPGGRFTITNMPLRVLIMNAFGFQSYQLVGAPDWITTERFDILAKMPDGAVAGGEPAKLMLRSLLAERFKLAVHSERRELPIYALVFSNRDGQLGPGLRRSDVDCGALIGKTPARPPSSDRPLCTMRMAFGRLMAGAIPVSQFTNALPDLLQRAVVNRTGLDGNFDIDLTWTPDQVPQEPPDALRPSVGSNGPSIFTAIQEQLGLKLESTKGPVEVLVIDHVERPSSD